jgi:hypothetical protein
MFDEEPPDADLFDDAQFGAVPGGPAEAHAATGPAGERLAGPALGPDHFPPRPGVSLIDAGLGAGYLVSRIAVGPARAVARAGQRLAPPARRALRAPAPRGLTDLSAWVLRTLAQVGAPQRSRAEHRVQSLARAATGAIAANRDVSRLVYDIATRQMDPLIDEALPLVLGRLDEQPEQVRKIVRGQSHGMMAEARDTARTSARRGDDAIDSVVDKLLRRRAPEAQAAPAQATPPQSAPAYTVPTAAVPTEPAPTVTVPTDSSPVDAAPTPAGPVQARGPGR